MVLRIINTGDSDCHWFNRYIKRIHRWKVDIITLSPKLDPKRYIKTVEPLLKGYRIFLDMHGKTMDSVKFAQFCDQHPSCTFLVGPSFGIPSTLTCDIKIAFGPMTFPHEIARILLIEQIYRGQQILLNHPYHMD